MHGSVLQNDKYIEFSNRFSVEVLALGSLQQGIDKKDPKADTYESKDEKDEDGKPVKYLKEFAGMRVEDVLGLESSTAAGYNKTGKIPYTCIIDPYTLNEVKSFSGGISAKGLMEAVAEVKDKLNKDHGPSIDRTSLQKLEASLKEVETTLTKAGAAK